ncbi:MAG: hypothetical protein Salg2KO_09880 [Salibacteraceae bacterium]
MVVFAIPEAYSQSPDFKSLKRGVFTENTRVLSFAQDNNNRLHIGTSKKGLWKYDGHSLSKHNLPDSLSNSAFTALLYHNHQLWIGTSNGELFQLADSSLRAFDHPSFNASAKITMLYDFAGGIGVNTYGNGIYLVFDDGRVEHYDARTGLADDYTYDMAFSQNRLWVGTDGGISSLDTSSGAHNTISMRDGLRDNIVQAIEPVSDSLLAIGMYEGGISFYNTKTASFITVNLAEDWSHGPINSLVLADDDRLWVGTKGQGIVWIDGIESSQTALRSLSQINGLESNRVECLFLDSEKSVWVGTVKGASLYTNPEIEYLTTDEGLVAKNVYDILATDHNVHWLATDQGVFKFSYDENGEGMSEQMVAESISPTEQIVSLYKYSDRIMLLGSYGSGLFVMDAQDGSIKNYGEKEGLLNLNVLDITGDDFGNIWLGTLGGGVVCARLNDEGELQFIERDDVSGISSEYVYTLFVDDNQQLWVGTDGAGISVIDCESRRYRTGFEALPRDQTVYSICGDLDGGIWFSTDDARLYHFAKGKLLDRTADLMMSGQSIQGLIANKNGDVLAIHNLGIEVLTADKVRFDLIKPNRSGFEFVPNLNALALDENDVWVGTELGAVKWLSTPQDRKIPTPLVSLSGINVLYEPYDLEDSPEFNYDESHFVFEYQSVWLKSPEDVRFEYMLDGFDKKWSFPTEMRLATYSSLPPGDYTFKVRASSDGDHWSDPATASYSFTVLKPFWMEWWFYVLILIGLGASVRGIVVYRTKKLIADKEALEEEVNKRTAEIVHQKEIIEHKSEEILASITYAKRIQTAILPTDHYFKANLPDSFVLYKPKDIVAGDFYWMTRVDDCVIFAAADCTGHGVPGAMVSVVCSNALNRAVGEYGLSKPADILFKTRELVIERFERQSKNKDIGDDTIKDGMDIALCALQPSTNELFFAGAQNPLWVVSQREKLNSEPDITLIMENGKWLHEYKPDKQPIGKYAEMKPYTHRVVKLEDGDVMYLFTDGFADQFGGDRGKKLKYKPFKKLLSDISDHPMAEQHKQLDLFFEEWRGDLEQVDDVCVIGVRL